MEQLGHIHWKQRTFHSHDRYLSNLDNLHSRMTHPLIYMMFIWTTTHFTRYQTCILCQQNCCFASFSQLPLWERSALFFLFEVKFPISIWTVASCYETCGLDWYIGLKAFLSFFYYRKDPGIDLSLCKYNSIGVVKCGRIRFDNFFSNFLFQSYHDCIKFLIVVNICDTYQKISKCIQIRCYTGLLCQYAKHISRLRTLSCGMIFFESFPWIFRTGFEHSPTE